MRWVNCIAQPSCCTTQRALQPGFSLEWGTGSNVLRRFMRSCHLIYRSDTWFLNRLRRSQVMGVLCTLEMQRHRHAATTLRNLGCMPGGLRVTARLFTIEPLVYVTYWFDKSYVAFLKHYCCSQLNSEAFRQAGEGEKMSPIHLKKTVWIVLLCISNLGVASSSMIDFLYVIPGHRKSFTYS
jgi:hypothetical protein